MAASGVAPIGHRVVCVDFDGCLFPFGPLYAEEPPFPGAVDAMKRLRAAGYHIVILTSRLSETWLASDAEAGGYATQVEYVLRLLRRYGIPFDDLTAEKVPAEFYLDDRAMRVDGSNWPEVADAIVGLPQVA